jgi:hypothetical protein
VAQQIPALEVARTDLEEFVLHLKVRGDDVEHKFYLRNTFAEFQHLSSEERRGRLEAVLLDMVASSLEGPLDWSEARERLVPVVRCPSNFFAGPETVPVVRRPFLPFLLESVVVDSGARMRYVTDKQPREWGVDVEDVFAQARRNLAACDHGVQPCPNDRSLPLLYVGTDDDYESSRLLLPGWLADFEGRVRGRPIAIIPDRRTLIVGGSEEPGTIEYLLARAEEVAHASPRYLSVAPYVAGAQGSIEPLEVGDDHSLSSALRRAQRLLAGTEYENQKQYLDTRHDRDGTDIFVASFSGIRRPDGEELSYSTWGEGVDTLLPKTDLIAMGRLVGGDADTWHVMVPWEDVVRIAGSCLQQDPGCDPPRYRTVRWPEPQQVAELRKLGERG